MHFKCKLEVKQGNVVIVGMLSRRIGFRVAFVKRPSYIINFPRLNRFVYKSGLTGLHRWQNDRWFFFSFFFFDAEMIRIYIYIFFKSCTVRRAFLIYIRRRLKYALCHFDLIIVSRPVFLNYSNHNPSDNNNNNSQCFYRFRYWFWSNTRWLEKNNSILAFS